MFGEFLLVSGYAFWIVIGFLVVLDALLLSRSTVDDGWPTFIAVAGLIGAVLFTDAFAGVRLASFAIGLAAYLAFGVTWSLWKWYGFLVDERDSLRKRYDGLKNHDGTWAEYAETYRPIAARNKGKITNWMMLWPLSFSWWVLTWPRRAFIWLYDRLSNVFDRMASRVFAS